MRQHHCTMRFQTSKSPEIWRCFCITESYKLIESYWGRGTVQYSAPIFAKKLFQTHSEVSRLFFLQYVSPHNDSISDPQTSTETETLAGGQWALVPQSDIKTPREVDREWQNSILWKKNHKLIKSVSIVSPRQQWDKMETPVSQHISVMCSIFIWMQTFSSNSLKNQWYELLHTLKQFTTQNSFYMSNIAVFLTQTSEFVFAFKATVKCRTCTTVTVNTLINVLRNFK